MSSLSAWRWVTSAMGDESATARLSAWTDLSRPTWRGTIISGKMTVSRRATSGSWRTVPCSTGRSSLRVSRVLVVIGSPWGRCGANVAYLERCGGRFLAGLDGAGFDLVVSDRPFGVERLEDAHPE